FCAIIAPLKFFLPRCGHEEDSDSSCCVVRLLHGHLCAGTISVTTAVTADGSCLPTRLRINRRAGSQRLSIGSGRYFGRQDLGPVVSELYGRDRRTRQHFYTPIS